GTLYCDADVQSSKSGVPRVGCDCQCGPGASVANGAPPAPTQPHPLLNHDLPVAQNLGGHGLQRRVDVAGVEFRDHSLALLLPTFALVFTPLHLPRLPLLPCTHKIAIGDSDLINVRFGPVPGDRCRAPSQLLGLASGLPNNPSPALSNIALATA